MNNTDGQNTLNKLTVTVTQENVELSMISCNKSNLISFFPCLNIEDIRQHPIFVGIFEQLHRALFTQLTVTFKAKTPFESKSLNGDICEQSTATYYSNDINTIAMVSGCLLVNYNTGILTIPFHDLESIVLKPDVYGSKDFLKIDLVGPHRSTDSIKDVRYHLKASDMKLVHRLISPNIMGQIGGIKAKVFGPLSDTHTKTFTKIFPLNQEIKEGIVTRIGDLVCSSE